jgi:hypothetical protein
LADFYLIELVETITLTQSKRHDDVTKMIVSYISVDSGHPFTSLHVDTNQHEAHYVLSKITEHLQKYSDGRDYWIVSADGFELEEMTTGWKLKELVLFVFWEVGETGYLNSEVIESGLEIPRRTLFSLTSEEF